MSNRGTLLLLSALVICLVMDSAAGVPGDKKKRQASQTAAPLYTTRAPNLNPLRIDAGPNTILPGLTKTFSVGCSLENVTSSEHPLNIILYKYGEASSERQKIATVAWFEPWDIRFEPSTTNASGTCYFKDGRFDLMIHWDNPQKEQAGDYECEALIMDSDSKQSAFEKQTTIDYRTATQSDKFEYLQNENTDLKNQLAFSAEVMLHSSGDINGIRYHLSKLYYVDFDTSEKVCQMVGGHLVVFENRTEVQNALDFVNSLSYRSISTNSFVMGINYETDTGNLFNSATGQLVNFNMFFDEPYQQCAFLRGSSIGHARYESTPCSDPYNNKLFMCKSG